MKYNSAIAAMKGLLNEISEVGHITLDELEMFISILNPFAPHITEEIWEMIGGEGLLSLHAWPQYDEAKTVDAVVEIAVQINGKLRSVISVPADADEKVIEEQALADTKVQAAMAGMKVVKTIVIKKKIVNFVVKPE